MANMKFSSLSKTAFVVMSFAFVLLISGSQGEQKPLIPACLGECSAIGDCAGTCRKSGFFGGACKPDGRCCCREQALHQSKGSEEHKPLIPACLGVCSVIGDCAGTCKKSGFGGGACKPDGRCCCQ